MRNIISTYADRFIHERQTRLRTYAVILALAVVVTGFIFWGLHDSGIAMVNETYCGYEEHQHTADCYEQVLVCGLEENDDTGHTHDGSCLTTVKTLSCGLEESEGHTHDEDCFDVNGNLTCTVAECAGHTHTESCYTYSEILTCGLAESPDNSHTHDESCYETVLVCGIPEHEHDITCMSDETADVETERDWEDTLPELTGVWADDVVAVAESQLGYTESEANFQYSGDTDSRSGYTRYGAWYGNEYGDWDAMFAAFCLYYAGVKDMPVNSGAYAWAAALNEEDLYMGAETCDPAPGDLVFLNTEGNRNADVVAIITGVDEETGDITVIQGDSDDAVEEYVIKAGDECIIGYGILPEQTEDAAGAAVPTVPVNIEDETEPADARVPEDTENAGTVLSGEEAAGTEPEESADSVTAGELTEQTVEAVIYSGDNGVNPLSASESVVLSGLMPEGASAAAYPVDVTIGGMTILAAYDITIYDADGSEYEPKNGEVHVKISNSAIREALNNDAELVVCHINDETSELESVDLTGESDGAVEFDAESFSIYIVGEDEDYHDLETGETVTVYTVEFYQYEFDAEDTDNSRGPNLTSTQYVTANDTLNEPAVPEYEHHVFDGWFTEMQISAENEPGNKFDFTKTLQANLDSWGGSYTAGEHHTIKLYTDYDPVYYVYFMTEEDPVLGSDSGESYVPYVFHTDTYHENNSALDTSNVGILYWQQYLQVEQDTSELTTYAVVDWYYYENGAEHTEANRKYISDEELTGEDGVFHVTNDLTLYPVVDGAIWIYFDMNVNGSGFDEVYIEPSPAYVLANAEVVGNVLPEAERAGYTFEGWYTETSGGTKIDEKTTFEDLKGLLKENSNGAVTLYAHWTPTTVGYTINFWRQKATDGAAGVDNKTVRSGETFEEYINYYDFAESIHVPAEESSLKAGDTDLSRTDFGSYTESGRFGQTTTVYNWDDWTGYGTVTDSDSGYYGFEYDQTRTLNNLAEITVAPDGSTIINIFYDRVTITWNFGTSSNRTATGTLIGLYGTNVETDNPAGTLNKWPELTGNNMWYNSGTVGGYLTFETSFVIFSGSTSVNFTSNSFSQARYGYYYLEVTNEETQVDENGAKAQEAASYGVPYTRTVNNTLYVYERRILGSSNKFSITNKYAGYEVVGYTRVRTGYEDTSTTYTEASEGDEIAATITSGFRSYDADFYLFHNARKYTITLVSNSVNVGFDETTREQKDGGDGATYTFKYGQDLTSVIFPDELDAGLFGPAYYYQFTGTWWEDPTFTAVFQKPDTMPANNLVAYADWELKDITVTFLSAVDSNLYDLLVAAYGAYDEDTDPNGVKKNDDGSYSITIKASESVDDTLAELEAVYAEEETDKDRYRFVSWMDGTSIFNVTGHLYDDITLVASWNDAEKETHTLTYDLNLDPDSQERVTYSDGRGHTTDAESGEWLLEVEDAFSVDEFEYDADKFICWNTQPDGTGTDYYPDELYNFANDHEDVTLYAKWATELESVLHVHYNYPDGYYDRSSYTEYSDVNIVVENLGTVDLSTDLVIDEGKGIEFHALTEGDEIVVDGVTYRFAGWSTNEDANTQEDVEIGANATVAVDGADTNEERINNIYAVWLAELQFTIEKTDTDGNEVEGAEFTLSYTKTVVAEDEAGGEPTTTTVTRYYSYDERTQSYSWVELTNGENAPTITLGGISFTDHDGDLDGSEAFILTEVSAPEGYSQLSSAITFHLDATNSNVVIDTNVAGQDVSAGNLAGASGTVLTVQNESESNENILYIFKYTGDLTGEYAALPNAEFVLTRTATKTDEHTGIEGETTYYGVFGTTVIEGDELEAFFYTYTLTGWTTDDSQATALVTGTDGMIHLEGLAVGDYCLTETKAPDGYMLMDEAVRFTLSSDGNVTVEDTNSSVVIPDDSGYVTLCIENGTGGELPKTGGVGIWMFTALGLIIICGAGYLLCRKKKAANR